MHNTHGEIYILTCPIGKVYIGQAVCYLANGNKYGTKGRWWNHVSDSKRKNGGNCRKLNEAIRIYGETNFSVYPLLTTTTDLLDDYESQFISYYNSTCAEFGYNVRPGGNHSRLSNETRQLMSKNRCQTPCFQQNHTDVTKKRISETILNNVVRHGHNGIVLPKYVKFIDWKDRQGYAIVSHPNCKIRYFVSKKKDINDLYNQCIACLSSLTLQKSG